MLRLLRIWNQLTLRLTAKLAYEVVRLSSLGLNTNSFDRPPTVDGWVSYNDLLSAFEVEIQMRELTIQSPEYRQ